MSADPIQYPVSPATVMAKMRACSRKRPTIEITRTFSLTSGTPGRSPAMPRTIRSTRTPACEAR